MQGQSRPGEYNYNTVQTTNLLWSIEDQYTISKFIPFFQKIFNMDVLIRAKLIKLSPVSSNIV
jgi:hypothetical protein